MPVQYYLHNLAVCVNGIKGNRIQGVFFQRVARTKTVGPGVQKYIYKRTPSRLQRLKDGYDKREIYIRDNTRRGTTIMYKLLINN